MPPVLNQAEKAALITNYFRRYRPAYVIETGLWAGNGSCFGLKDEATVMAIDAQTENVVSALAKGIRAFVGNSAEILPAVLVDVEGPALFWLDAHWMGFEGEPDESCPLMAELAAIVAWPHWERSVVLIDDMRMIGEPGWPTRAELETFLRGYGWHIEEDLDVLRLTPEASDA